MADPLHLPAPAWATSIDEADKDGITWRRAASIRPLVNDDVVGAVRSEMELGIERPDCIQEGFTLVEGPLLVFVDDKWFAFEEARRLRDALSELLDLVNPDGGAR